MMNYSHANKKIPSRCQGMKRKLNRIADLDTHNKEIGANYSVNDNGIDTMRMNQ